MINLDSSQGHKDVSTYQIDGIDYINKRQKPHDHLNRYRKSIWYNSTSIHDKNSHQCGYRENISQKIRATYDKPIASILLSDEKIKTFHKNLK